MTKQLQKFSESLLTLSNRSKLSLSGVEKVIETSPTKVFLIVGGSSLKISGTQMQIEKLDVENGLLKLNGLVNEIKYDEKKVSFFKKLFK